MYCEREAHIHNGFYTTIVWPYHILQPWGGGGFLKNFENFVDFFFYVDQIDFQSSPKARVLCTKRPKIKMFISRIKTCAVESDWLI